jgi:hypothetical protein
MDTGRWQKERAKNDRAPVAEKRTLFNRLEGIKILYGTVGQVTVER